MKTLKTVFGAVALASLVACGGGGGGATALAPIELNGVAVKGLIKNGKVEAFAITNGVVSTTPVDTATTDNTGAYKLTKVPADALVKIQVSATSSTKVVDEVTGADYTPTPDFKLSAVLQTVAGSANEAHITQATDMVVKRTEALTGGFTPSNAAFASGEIQKSLGFAPGQKPTFAADGITPTSAAAVYLKSVQLVAKDSTAASTLGCTGTDDASRVTCVTTKMAEKAAKGGSEFTAVTSAITAKQTTAKVGTTEAVKSEVTAPVAVAEAKSVTVPTDLPTSAIAGAKAFVLALKTSFKTLASSEPTDTTFESQLTKVTDDFKATTTPANDYAIDAAGFMLDAANIYKKFKDDPATFNATPAINKNGLIFYCAWFKGIEDFQQNVAATTVAAQAGLLRCRFNEKSESTSYKTSAGQPIRYFSGVDFLVNGDSKKQDIYSYAIRRLEYNTCEKTGNCWLTLRNASQSPVFLQTLPAVANYPADITLSNINKATVTIIENTSSSVKGKLDGFIATSVQNNPSQIPVSRYYPASTDSFNKWVAADKYPTIFLGTKHGINLDVAATKIADTAVKTTDVLTLKISGFHSLYKEGTEPHSVINLEDVTMKAKIDTIKDTTTPTDFSIKLSVNSANASFTGSIVGGEFKTGLEKGSEFKPTSLVLDANIKLKTDDVFVGKITLLDLNRDSFDSTKVESETNFSKGSIEIAGDFIVPKKDPLALNIKLVNLVYQKPTATVLYSQNKSPMISVKVYDAPVATDRYVDMAFGPDITISNIKSSDSSFEMKKNGVKIATYNKATKKLEYLDGSFENF